jgi:predicted transcriptional regulator
MEGRLGPNHTKVRILQYLLDGKWQLTFEIADACGLSRTNASELLRRYCSQGLVCRLRLRDGLSGFAYQITKVGRDRYHYLERLHRGATENSRKED